MKDNKSYKYIKDYLKIIKRNIHRIFSYNKLFFFIFHGLQIMSLIALIYSYSHMRIENDNYQANIMMSSTYTVDFLQGVKYESISDKLNDINLDDVNEVIISLSVDGSLISKYKSKTTKVDYGNYFQNTNDIIYKYSMFDKNQLQINDYVEVLGRSYRIVGLKMVRYSEILLDSIKAEDTIYSLQVKYNRIHVSENERNKISNGLYNIFNYQVIKPQLTNIEDKYSFDPVLFSILILVVIVIVNIILIYRFMINKERNVYSIYITSGIKKRDIIISIIIELLFYFIIDLLIVSVLWFSFIKNILQVNYITILNSKDFIIPVTAYFIISLMVYSYNLIKFFNRSFVKYLK